MSDAKPDQNAKAAGEAAGAIAGLALGGWGGMAAALKAAKPGKDLENKKTEKLLGTFAINSFGPLGNTPWGTPIGQGNPDEELEAMRNWLNKTMLKAGPSEKKDLEKLQKELEELEKRMKGKSEKK